MVVHSMTDYMKSQYLLFKGPLRGEYMAAFHI